MQTQPESRLVPLHQIAEPADPSRLTIDRDGIAELAASIARLGLLEPIGIKTTAEPDRYVLSYGHRRLLAMRFLGWYDGPAIILPETVSELEARQAENNQRVQLTPVEEARELRRYADAGESISTIAHRISRSPSWVTQRLRLLTYPDDLMGAIHAHGLALAVADQLAHIDHAGYRVTLIDEALRNGATAATAAAWVQHYNAERPRVIANETTIEEIAARRGDYRILSPCEYCGTATDLELTRSWRLCAGCSNGLAGARHQPAAVEA